MRMLGPAAADSRLSGLTDATALCSIMLDSFNPMRQSVCTVGSCVGWCISAGRSDSKVPQVCPQELIGIPGCCGQWTSLPSWSVALSPFSPYRGLLTGLSCIRCRYQDFMVNEIDTAGKVVHLTSLQPLTSPSSGPALPAQAKAVPSGAGQDTAEPAEDGVRLP